MMGWRIEGEPPTNLDKYVITVGPHTSNWDFVMGVMVRSITRMKVKYLAKQELFVFPFGWFFRALGGYPVNRTKNTNMVDNVVAIFEHHQRFAIAVTPEGTRKKVQKLKTGFYYIADKAKVPIVMAGLDYKNKCAIFSDPFFPQGDIESDLRKIIGFYSNVTGKIPAYGIGGNELVLPGKAQSQ
ncbi:1-acyl-sn-glycerol-3-phosphate acyltransferase [Splendidivirga corallicola]